MTTTMALNSPKSNAFNEKVKQVKNFFKLPTSEQKAIILDTAKENLKNLAIGGLVGVGVVAYQNSDAIREVFDNPNDPNKKEVVAPVVNATDTMDPEKTKLDAFTKTLEEENQEAVGTEPDLEGGDGSDPENLGTGLDNTIEFNNGSWFQFDDTKGIISTDAYNVVPNGKQYIDIFNEAYTSGNVMAVELFAVLKKIDDDEALSDAEANEYILALLMKYAQKKSNIGVSFRQLSGQFEKSEYRETYQKLDKWDGKDKRMDLNNDDFDPFADFDVMSDDLERAQKRLEESLTQGREKIIKAAKDCIEKGKNPADIIENWEEVMKEFNITPEDL